MLNLLQQHSASGRADDVEAAAQRGKPFEETGVGEDVEAVLHSIQTAGIGMQPRSHQNENAAQSSSEIAAQVLVDRAVQPRARLNHEVRLRQIVR